MEFFECVMGRRSCRRFKQDPVSREDLDRMIDAGRYAPTGYNKQPIKFALITSPEKVAQAFKFTGWLTGRPSEDEKPAAYVVILCDTEISDSDSAVSCATYAVMLAAHALGYGSCWHGCAGNEEVKAFLGLPDNLDPRLIVSLGRRAEEAVVHDPSTDWKVRKADDGKIHLGKFGRKDVTAAVL